MNAKGLKREYEERSGTVFGNFLLVQWPDSKVLFVKGLG